MVVQVRLHREPPPEQGLFLTLRDPPEPLVELQRRAVGLVRDLPGDAQPDVRAEPVGLVVVVPAVEAGVRLDGTQLDVERGDLVPGGLRGARDHRDRGHPVRRVHRPLQHPVPAHRPADHQRPARDPEGVRQRDLGGDLVAHGQQREA